MPQFFLDLPETLKVKYADMIERMVKLLKTSKGFPDKFKKIVES